MHQFYPIKGEYRRGEVETLDECYLFQRDPQEIDPGPVPTHR